MLSERNLTAERRDLEDMSTLGMDWDNETMETAVVTKEGGSIATGDIDEDDIEADEKRYLEQHAMIVDGYKCPDEFIKIITPMEFEEMVNLFTKFDVDHSNTIDKHETKKILLYLGMDASLDMAKELLEIIDVDKSGEIDFNEFCNFIVMLKRGDPRLQGYSSMLDVLNSTPLGELERQASSRHLKIRFVIVEKREATLTQPTNYIVEAQVSGIYHTMVDGDVEAKHLVKRFQGMGVTTKEAKYNAASNAILNLGEAMPGVRCKEGEFPDEWLDWLNENLMRGVDAGKIVGILASKGFHPHRNAALMHRILTWCSLDRFLAEHPEMDVLDTSVRIPEDFFEWVKETCLRGIDGEVLLKVLEDRCIDLKKDSLYFAQQLENNELGSLKDKNGQSPEILDFWHACKNGYLDDVVIYCKCGVQVNEEKLDRHSSERTTPLMYAAGYGHAEIVKVLLSYGADPKHVDLRGRSACHHAALRGHTACCAYLVDGGAMMFAGDIQRNTPLHLAAMNNHLDCVNYLAFKALDVTRMMTSDKIKVKKNKTFLELTEEIFNKLPEVKLTSSDTVRVEKIWLNDAANLFISKMDKDVIHMLAPSSEEIMEDVLQRFDPRPESGVFLTGGVNGEQIFVKTVTNPTDLAILLKYTFRQSALDTINNWKRTPLHMACDANHINSHEALILRMIDFHGCNSTMKDIHGRRPIDLLIKDKVLQNMPTSTQVREELLIDRRAVELERLFGMFDAQDAERTRMRRKAIIDECIEEDGNMSERLWHCLREAALYKKTYGKNWEMYEDPDTGNYFFCRMPKNLLMGDSYDAYSWDEPLAAKALIDRTNALQYLLRVRSTFLRQYEEWQAFRCNRTGIQYYYNASSSNITFDTPKHLQWRPIMREATNTKRRLGYGNEWEVFEDRYGNNFYRNAITRQCEYERPHDAVDVKPAEMLCSAYQHKGKSTVQNWYSCEQCNRAWKSSPMGSTATVKICEPCIVRCHAGHKGVRLIRNSQALCNCATVCKVTSCTCNALVISASQTRVQTEAIAVREEIERQRQRNLDFPPVLAVVPRTYFDGAPKVESGWMICRVCTTIEPSTGSRTRDDGSLMISNHGDDASLLEASAVESDSETSLQSHSMRSLDSGSLSPASLETGTESKALSSRASVGVLGLSGQRSFALALQANGSMRVGLPPGWLELFDVEEPTILKYEDRVLVKRYSSQLKKYATIKHEVRKGFYRVKYDDRTIPDEVIERSYIELISRKKFYCNPDTGQCAWTMFQAQNNPIESQALTLTGPSWFDFHDKAIFRRPFGMWSEMINPYVDMLFYVNNELYAAEKAALQLQSVFRSTSRRARPYAEWASKAFQFDVPEEVRGLQKEWAGWAYLRRRSNNVGEFLDVEGVEWEEYTDKKTSEYFYWCEESNLYQWEKPAVFQRNLDARELLKEGEEVMFVFPGRRAEEMAIITKVRFDDETGEDMYDLVHKYVPELAFKWIPRMQIKFVPKEGDALMLAKLEVKWKIQLRRKREADERKAKRDKELAMAAEVRRLEEMKTMAYRMGKREESLISTNTRIIRGRIKRLELEDQEIKERIDLTEGKARRDRIQEIMNQKKQEHNLTRSDVLSMTRAMELKMKIEDKVATRNLLRKELIAKKKESGERTLFIEETLRDGEIRTTTPRSLVRRRIVRRMHIAMQRQKSNFMICEWGCGDWFRVGKEQIDHQLRRCVRRIIGCTLGCPLKHTEEFWLSAHLCSRQTFNPNQGSIAESNSTESAAGTMDSDAEIFYGGSFAERARTPKVDDLTVGMITQQQYHETEECPKRLIMCPKQCLEWVCAELLDKHLTEQCTKRPAKPIACRLGCGLKFGGQVETLIQAEDERLQHETEECNLRMVRCTWQFEDGRICAAQMRADEREEHRDYHLTLQGMMTYTIPGTYLYKIPKKLTRLKVQLWGAGGGSGYFEGRQGGSGGGGAFVEAIIQVEPFSVLELVVGGGGGAGVNGSHLQTVDIEEQRRRMALRRDKEIHMPKGEKMVHSADDEYAVALLVEEGCGLTLGGIPGGGEGYGGSGCWASGGGGGYTMISKRTAMGSQALLIAAGGGGGASLDGLPGGGLEGVLAGTLLDPLNGTTATVEGPGKGGESGSTYNAAWCSTPGLAWQGGNGCEFGAGGGGGYYGGGGGGTSPGISGGGGGGSSYVYTNICHDHVIITGHGMQPGGINHNPPAACGLGEWDKVGGFAGQGGTGDPHLTRPGNNGAIRLTKPGHY